MSRLDFKHPVVAPCVLFVHCLAIPTILSGCDRHVANTKPAEKVSPETRFERVMDSFRRKIEGQPVGFVVTEGGSRTMMSGTNKVTSQIIPPESADGHYKAIVTVTSESRYSVRRTKSFEELEHEKNGQKQGSSVLDDPKERKGASILEPDLEAAVRAPATSSSPSNQPPEEVVSRRPNEDTRKYELTYENDHWVLLTKPDPKTEQSIEFAFSEALARQ